MGIHFTDKHCNSEMCNDVNLFFMTRVKKRKKCIQPFLYLNNETEYFYILYGFWVIYEAGLLLKLGNPVLKLYKKKASGLQAVTLNLFMMKYILHLRVFFEYFIESVFFKSNISPTYLAYILLELHLFSQIAKRIITTFILCNISESMLLK